jgi:aspartyl-tRNA(Asn)/glutamyl-tRNA(Gln) amidotransferase subunit C
MTLTIHDVEKMAHLARLQLTEDQKLAYLGQLSAILDYAEMLNELDIDDVLPTSSAVSLHNVMRADKVRPSLSLEDVLFNAPQQAKNQFRIQGVFDDA